MKGQLNVLVRRERAEEVRRVLKGERLLDPARKIRSLGGEVIIPVLSLPSVDLERFQARMEEDDGPVERLAKVDPFDKVVRLLDREQRIIESLPRKWEKVGNVLVLKLPPELGGIREEVAEAYAKVLKAESVLQDVSGISGEWRLPQVEKIWGGETETVHLEDGVRFKLDVSKVMFSSGNLPERMRMGRIVRLGEVVVDMFAGIGYFTLPMAVHSRPRKIFACEVNPTAFHYLEENIRINRAGIVEPLPGDCRETAPEAVADRVVMGYLRAQEFLPKAFRILKREGMLHYHEACPNELIDSRPFDTVSRAAEEQGRDVKLIKRSNLKSYAPGVTHVVLDVKVGAS